ncbi:MAG: hypothetical protein QOE34_113 [Verrucomicrobiota bacterium]|jgi:uncharacterized membrane protein
MIHSWLGSIHTSAAMAALLFGAFVFPMIKGTRLHKVLGYLYAAALLATNVTAFGLYHLTGHFGMFHIAAIVSFLTLVAALIPVITRRPRKSWLTLHYKYTSWSYVGLLAAAVSEAAVRLPHAPFWPAVAFGSAIFFGAGGWLIARMKDRTVARALPITKDLLPSSPPPRPM